MCLKDLKGIFEQVPQLKPFLLKINIVGKYEC